MTTLEIQKKAKYIIDINGKPKEVILPYNVYKKLLALELSMEIFRQGNTQESIKRAKIDIKKGRVKSFDSAKDAVEWLGK